MYNICDCVNGRELSRGISYLLTFCSKVIYEAVKWIFIKTKCSGMAYVFETNINQDLVLPYLWRIYLNLQSPRIHSTWVVPVDF